MNILALTEQDRLAAAAIIYECFKSEYQYLSPDQGRVIRCIASMLTDRFFAAYLNGEMAGVLGYSTKAGRACRFSFNAFKSELGLGKACIAQTDLSSDVSLTRYKQVRSGEAVLLEFIGTAPRFRGMGVASGLINHAIDALPYQLKKPNLTFIIEVYEANPALNLYKKLGFSQTDRRRVVKPPQKGYTHMLRLERTGEDK